MKKKALLSFFLIGALSMLVMSLHYLYRDGTGILQRKEIATASWYILIFRTHVLLGLLAIFIGPSQFIHRLRSRQPRIHKVLGYGYAISVFLSSTSGLVIAQFAMGGWISTLGFSVLAILWWWTMLQSILAIRKGDLRKHRRWSYFSYALTFSAISQRTLLLVPLLTSIPFLPIYRLSAWLPWMLNLGIAFLLLRSVVPASIKEGKPLLKTP